jgi:hypothetical protein
MLVRLLPNVDYISFWYSMLCFYYIALVIMVLESDNLTVTIIPPAEHVPTPAMYYF